jgi:hypothetical protein
MGALILQLTYGYKVQETDDPFVAQADKAIADFNISGTPGAFLVDLVPICESRARQRAPKFVDILLDIFIVKYIPEWFPGGGFKKIAREHAATLNRAAQEPIDFVKASLVSASLL